MKEKWIILLLSLLFLSTSASAATIGLYAELFCSIRVNPQTSPWYWERITRESVSIFSIRTLTKPSLFQAPFKLPAGLGARAWNLFPIWFRGCDVPWHEM